MKKLIFVIPARLRNDGSLMIKRLKNLELMLVCLKENYDVYLLVQTHREKHVQDLDELGLSVFYDNSLQMRDRWDYSSRYQKNYHQWTNRKILTNVKMKEMILSEYDGLIAWDGCSPWCLATALTCVRAKRRILWLHDNPDLYLMRTDQDFYSSLCNKFDALISSGDGIQKNLLTVISETRKPLTSVVLALPVDSAWYWKQSKDKPGIDFHNNELNLLVISRMSKVSMLEQLPAMASSHLKQKSALHIYVVGDGPRMDHYFQQVAIYDVDSQFTLLGNVRNIYPLIRACDGLIVCEEDENLDAETAARVFGVHVISFDELSSNAFLVSKKKEPYVLEEDVWPDKNRFIQIIEGV